MVRSDKPVLISYEVKLGHFYGVEGKFLSIHQGMYEEVLNCFRVNKDYQIGLLLSVE